jgi:glycosyltransferase involved in cell wall biosynthesis
MAAAPTLPGFDLVIATVDRVEPLERLLDSLERQSHGQFRVLVVDQNQDDRLESVISGHSGLDIVHLRSARGLSRARNAALDSLSAEIVAFPDDDCVYADDLLERVAQRFAQEPSLGGLTGRRWVWTASRPSWKRFRCARPREPLESRDLVHDLLRRDVVSRVGRFDSSLARIGPPGTRREID